jgi:hypothetical protein
LNIYVDTHYNLRKKVPDAMAMAMDKDDDDDDYNDGLYKV